jgi:hypothetical protein
MNFLCQILYCADTAIQCLLLVLLLRGPFRKYPVFALYALGEFAADAREGIAYYRLGWESPAYRKLYWTDHMALELLLLLMVAALTYAAVQGNPQRSTATSRSKSTAALAIIVAATVALPFAMLHNHYNVVYGFFTSRWYSHTIQIWSFGAAIMNFVLWAALLSNRRRDIQLVTLSVGVGVTTSSAAIVWGARQWLEQSHRWPLDSFMTVAHLATLVVWCWAFRPKAAGPSGAAKSPGKSPYPEALGAPL